MIPMMKDALRKARIAVHSRIRPRIKVTMLTTEVSMPSAWDRPSTKLLLALLNRLNSPLRASTMKRMIEPSTWPSHSEKPSTCME
ncbi:hypothetical protein D9M72_631840 [compost metagenome]